MIVSFDTIKGSNKFAVKLSQVQDFHNLRLTARQYGEVVLPGAAIRPPVLVL